MKKMIITLPEITEEDRKFLHYNPNTSDIVELVQNYAMKAIEIASNVEASNTVSELQNKNNQLAASIAAIHCRLSYGHRVTDATVKAIIDECEYAFPELAQLRLTLELMGKPEMTETTENSPSVGPVSPLERLVVPALDYASHIAACTERLMAAMDRFDEADEAAASADTSEEEQNAMEEREEAALDINEHRRSITNAIYEYRKRLPEVLAALRPNAKLTGAKRPQRTDDER